MMQQWFNQFVKNIRPSLRVLQEADRQCDFMIEQLEGHIDEQEGLKIVRVIKGGSNATHTSIRKTDNTEYDADLHFYLQGDRVEEIHLRKFLRRKLINIYPNKDENDFETKRSAVKVKFRGGIGLNVDVVPVILDLSRPRHEWWGYIPRPGEERLYTSVPQHIEYVRSKTGTSQPPVKFNNVVRLMKWWSKIHHLKASSFAITILTGIAYESQSFTNNWYETLQFVFNHFHSTWVTNPNQGVPVRIGDPINSNNNAADDWTSNDLSNFKQMAVNSENNIINAYEQLQKNYQSLALEYLQKIFGNNFPN